MADTKANDADDEPAEAKPDQPENEAEVIASLESVLAEVNRQRDYRRKQVDTSVQLSRQLIGFASLTSPFAALSSVHVQWLKYVALFLLALAVAVGLIDICDPKRGEEELPLDRLRNDACSKSRKSVLLYQIDNLTANEAKARAAEDKRIRWVKRGYMLLGFAVLCTALSIIDYAAIAAWIQQLP
ncbi:hypothetical protein JS533_005165 [Bifidobacterium amazonense]|uniref:Transmembrane protein n=1 Tax=Bifidobacterium amazonense TaxID=2809027 RepID=A0ABS9VU93_9BIFI|nr:hypothetical protein [Bifidobacterium amazonense]MCH9275663.1 hypothetical protein [Bifidobacterium amazonense]